MDAEIAKTAREAELKKQEVEVAKQALDAEIRAKADAERYRKEQEAQAALFQRQKDAEAKRYEQEQEAEAVKKQAEAARFAKEQEAAGISAVGKAEAAAIQAKALAEAEGIDKKAEAMKKYGQAAVIEMVMNALPEIAKNVAQPLSKVDRALLAQSQEYQQAVRTQVIASVANLYYTLLMITRAQGQSGKDGSAFRGSLFGASSRQPEIGRCQYCIQLHKGV